MKIVKMQLLDEKILLSLISYKKHIFVLKTTPI